MSGPCPTCHGVGRVDLNPLDDVTATETTAPCPACGPVAAPLRRCNYCHKSKPHTDANFPPFSINANRGLRATCRECCARRDCVEVRQARRIGPHSGGLTRQQLVARLPAGICMCRCTLSAHDGIGGRCLACGACPEFMEHGS